MASTMMSYGLRLWTGRAMPSVFDTDEMKKLFAELKKEIDNTSPEEARKFSESLPKTGNSGVVATTLPQPTKPRRKRKGKPAADQAPSPIPRRERPGGSSAAGLPSVGDGRAASQAPFAEARKQPLLAGPPPAPGQAPGHVIVGAGGAHARGATHASPLPRPVS